jgi:hypothetical protein
MANPSFFVHGGRFTVVADSLTHHVILKDPSLTMGFDIVLEGVVGVCRSSANFVEQTFKDSVWPAAR